MPIVLEFIYETTGDRIGSPAGWSTIDPARFIREFVRAEPVEAQPFDRLRANGSHV